MNIAEILTTESTYWTFHEQFNDEHRAHAMMHFYLLNVGYKAVKVTSEPQEHMTVYSLYVLKNR